MKTAVLVIHPMGHFHGEWCSSCALPSAVRCVFAIGLRLFEVTVCGECGERWTP